ncbi:glutamate--cysteine ligase catalytic subunit-like [Rhopilema esculentum]|uniref:glutamate--cysteine ligase catalytic subunit-like n=1 Tax=Rhopilema esculentum TaxID=499914 RepID=UPI0031D97E87|eukprot:gene8108-14025_t
MGLLTFSGENLPFSEIKKYADHIKKHGIIQFINTYNRVKNRTYDTLKWGDEVEYQMLALDHQNKTVKLVLKSSEILPTLQKEENENPGKTETAYRVEMGEFMIESSPGQPYGGCMRHFNRVEANMKLRREEIQALLGYNETVLPLCVFPRLGCPDFTSPHLEVNPETNPIMKSLYIPDACLTQMHPRFMNLAGKPMQRKGERVTQNIPIYRDLNTPDPFLETFRQDDGQAAKDSRPNHVYLDNVLFGLGMCCTQVTFQGCNIDEARILYDQLAVLAPIMLALSAATPATKGYLLNTDCRWGIISGSVDDRTEEERGLKPLKENKFQIRKSRYDSIDMYISPEGAMYNDIQIDYEQEHMDMLLKAGIDQQLATHIAHFFIRDPISLFSDKIYVDDENELEHFDNIQSTCWQTIRFKPPPPGSDMGWRVEFRPMEVQLTDFENAAYTVFVVLMTRVILSFNLNMLVPISKMEENMKTALKRDAAHKGKFYFRKNIEKCFDENFNDCGNSDYELMSIDTIINGKDNEFPGLIPLINSYMDHIDVDIDTRCTISQYLRLISKRATGELMTTASWIRSKVRSHPNYKFDSVVSDEIVYDLVQEASKIAVGQAGSAELLGAPISKTSCYLPDKCKKMQEHIDEFSKIMKITKHSGRITGAQC